MTGPSRYWPSEDRYDPYWNERKLDHAVIRVRSGEYDAIRADMFNKAEADMLKAYAERVYPDIKVYYTWIFP